MLKRVIFTFFLLLNSIAASAVQLHLFSGYNSLRTGFFIKEKYTVQQPFWKEILPSGLGIHQRTSKHTHSEILFFFPNYFRGTLLNEFKTVGSHSLTGIIDINGKWLYPMPTAFSRIILFLKTGVWFLNHFEKTFSAQTPPVLLHKKSLYSYGLTLGIGGLITLPICPRFPIEVCIAGYIPTLLTHVAHQHLPHQKFWIFTAGFNIPLR